ncbi:GIY-YIG nuclease family protein [Streptomyces griseorubiginosus]|uniref:GIY-YIG nuclease family protein n=1 Tax=Streptomyces griseorubiginosus TaxID=67304 RepID=UPI002E817A3D|nr:GIY-YIG nuclease family protein [Streptomyces griseorubiginosus]WUB42113.1 GIY-YIG nuclease family protein [Streptomyces griseorubiginosus]WUB50632.1 GIY-YIG nuclease family protein [Streptomyces griseorubiginosus]
MKDIDTQFLRGLFDEEGSLHAAGRTALYRLYGLEGLLYVGITTSPLTRIRTHLREQPWGPRVIAVRIDYPDHAEAAERETVQAERPLYNVVFNGATPPPPPDPVARLRARLAAHQRRLAEFEAAVPESTTHLRLLVRGIASAQSAIARLTEEIAVTEAARRSAAKG